MCDKVNNLMQNPLILSKIAIQSKTFCVFSLCCFELSFLALASTIAHVGYFEDKVYRNNPCVIAPWTYLVS